MRAPLKALLLALAACAPTIENNGVRVRVSYWEPVEREINARARSDLECPQVSVQLLKRQGKAPVSVSAEGCGRTAVYLRTLRHHGPFHTTANSVWALVSASPVPPLPVAINPYSPAPTAAAPTDL
jgi:hypothetical protein